MKSLNSPLSNDILLVFHFSFFHGEISGLRKIPSPDINRRYFPNSDGQQKNVPNYDASKKNSILGKKTIFSCFSREMEGKCLRYFCRADQALS